jgi:hypothetical protein
VASLLHMTGLTAEMLSGSTGDDLCLLCSLLLLHYTHKPPKIQRRILSTLNLGWATGCAMAVPILLEEAFCPTNIPANLPGTVCC